MVAIDIDGVLNPRLSAASAPEGYVEHSVALTPGAVHLPFLKGGGREHLSGSIWLNPSHGQWIRTLLHHGIDVCWATSWEHYANDVIAPLLEIPSLPLAIEYSVDVHNGWYTHRLADSSWNWKVQALTNRYRYRPLVWIDDEATPLNRPKRVGRAASRIAPALTIRCNGGFGLTTHEMSKTTDWLRCL